MNKRKVGFLVIVVFALIGFGNVASRILKPWTLPSGGGQFKDSPNGLYEFSAWNLSDDAPWGRGYSYYKFEIKSWVKKEVIRTIRIPHPEPEETIGFRGPMVINWASDSSSVTVPVAEGVDLTVHVPFIPEVP